MPELPRDPRQLARDILSGKVRIEDLAKERQLRGPGGPARPQGDKVPLPRPAQRPPMQRPAAQPFPQQPRPQSRPLPSARPPAPRGPVGGFPRPQSPRPAPPPIQARPQQVTVPTPQNFAMPPAAAEPTAKPARRPVRINQLVRSNLALRQGVLLAEVLGKPVALRDWD